MNRTRRPCREKLRRRRCARSETTESVVEVEQTLGRVDGGDAVDTGQDERHGNKCAVVQFQQFVDGAWGSLTQWARDVTQRLNARIDTGDLAASAVTADKLAPMPSIGVRTLTSQSVPTATVQNILFDAIDWSSSAPDVPLFDVVSRTVIIRRDGIYDLTARIGSSLSGVFGGMGRWAAIIVVNGSNICQPSLPASTGIAVTAIAMTTMPLVVGDRVQVAAFQTTGVAQPTLVSGSDHPELIVSYRGSL